ncbi:hypothetical protein NQZ79_g4732 [Umbelopsis isabellina]|nr:hypothetical protein NQZ79_g4732 [Umbelopsis isabellina]
MSREHLSINSLTCPTDGTTERLPRKREHHDTSPPPPLLYKSYHPAQSDQLSPLYPPSGHNRNGSSPALDAHSPESSSSMSCVSPPNQNQRLARYPPHQPNRYSDHHYSYNKQSSSDPNSSSSSNGNHSGGQTSQEPMSLDERRKRNKAASAKYRAKKQIQITHMSNEINILTHENNLLQKKLKQICDDNDMLRAKIQSMQSDQETTDTHRKKHSRDEDRFQLPL